MHLQQLREAMNRQVGDIDRLIDEKRQLEADIHKQSENFNLSNLNTTNFNLR
jgi:hypothetical protein